MKKIFVLDINVFLYDFNVIFVFEEYEVIIFVVVLEEIDFKKRNVDEIGCNVWNVLRLFDGLCELGYLYSGVFFVNGGNLKVELNYCSFVRV